MIILVDRSCTFKKYTKIQFMLYVGFKFILEQSNREWNNWKYSWTIPSVIFFALSVMFTLSDQLIRFCRMYLCGYHMGWYCTFESFIKPCSYTENIVARNQRELTYLFILKLHLFPHEYSKTFHEFLQHSRETVWLYEVWSLIGFWWTARSLCELWKATLDNLRSI